MIGLFYILAITWILALMSIFIRNVRMLGRAHVIGYCVIMLISTILCFRDPHRPYVSDFFYVDGLSMLFIFLTALVSMTTTFHSVDYLKHAVEEKTISHRKAGFYYFLFNLFCSAMFLTITFKNLGLMWVAIEMTTLVSAFLVGFYNNKAAIEAAWKYVIICSVGIILALFGTIILNYTVANHAGIKNLNWPDILDVAKTLNPNVVKIAFLFILVGYGTKAGLAPMHTWLPDAHSQAISPISAMLSGVLLKTALYAILRFAIICNACVGSQFSSRLFIIFGILSLVVSAGFMLVQKKLKRLLAYSSIEHVGIISLGFGIAGPYALFGAFLHILGHAVTKPIMFFGAASVLKKYKTENLHGIKGVVSSLPFTGRILAVSVFALAGMPPFSLFFSEFYILMAGFLKGAYLVSVVYLICIVIIFCALLFHFGKILYGKKPAMLEVGSEPLLTKVAFMILLFFVCVLGIAAPHALRNLIWQAAVIVGV